MYTESDKPQCVECLEYKTKIDAAHKANDQALLKQLKDEKATHLANARSLFVYQKSQQVISKTYPEYASLVIDNAASKVTPKRRKEKNDAWSKDKLTWHIGMDS